MDPGLRCRGCGHVVPQAAGFAFFGHQRAPELGDPATWEALWARKTERPAWDVYAAFAPFNEAHRALLPLAADLRAALGPGDRVLDLCCRTGWTGEWLAGLLPDQEILSGWRGDHDVLGARGFAWWLPAGERQPNLDFAFFDPTAPLPFADDSFAAVHGHDLLHAADPDALLAECLRVSRSGAPLFFPHVHLSDAEPSPWFQRDGVLRSQAAYDRALAAALGPDRPGWVLSERALLSAAEGVVVEEVVRRHHHNALVCVPPVGGESPRAPTPDAGTRRVLRSPLVQVDPGTGGVRVAPEGMAGGAATILYRHPVHAQRLGDGMLDRVDRALLYEAERGHSVAGCAARVGLALAVAQARLSALQAREWIRVEPVSAAMARLHGYYRTQRIRPAAGESTLGSVWQAAVQRHGSRPLWVSAKDGSRFRYVDADVAVRLAAAVLADQGVTAGARVLVQSGQHPELPLIFWATVLSGASFVPVSSALGPDRLSAVIAAVQPAVSLVWDPDRWPSSDGPRLGFGDGASGLPSFVDACASAEPCASLPMLAEDQEAAVLFTSASTGPPKGVRLSQRALVRSARTLTALCGATAETRMLCTGGPHTMSGLRNACVVPVLCGGSLLVPPAHEVGTPVGAAGLVARWQVSHVTTTPAWLAACLQAGPRLRPLLQGLDAVLCTGSPLPAALRCAFTGATGVTVCDYYGLTETGGICVGVGPAEAVLAEAGVGRPRGALVDVRDAEGRSVAPGQPGRLWVYTDARASGYLGGQPLAVDAHGWLDTRDRAHLTPAGRVVLGGRVDRVLLHHGGENVQAEELEEALITLGGFSQALALCRPDPAGVGRIVALVSGPGTPGPALDQRLAQRLSSAHVPERLLAVAQLPLGPAGKPDVGACRALADRLLEDA